MTAKNIPDAWVSMPSEEELRAIMPPGNPYDFGFLPAMARLITAHPTIAPAFGALFGQIMFSTEGKLRRAEREMVAAVASAGQDCHY